MTPMPSSRAPPRQSSIPLPPIFTPTFSIFRFPGTEGARIKQSASLLNGGNGGRGREFKKSEWIDSCAIQIHTPMQMRTCRSTGRADLPDDLPSHDRVAFFDGYFGEMKIHRIEA